MLKKIKIILVMVAISFSLSMMSNTYSRYVANTTGSIETPLAKWQIMVNNEDILNNGNASISFTPNIEENVNVKENSIAPSSSGYFDINIDPSNVDVSFSYSINLTIENENIPDLLITKYAILPDGYVEGDPLDIINLETYEITQDMLYSGESPFSNFTIRVFFEWYEGENEQMDDAADASIGALAATNDTKFIVSANIEFKQKI